MSQTLPDGRAQTGLTERSAIDNIIGATDATGRMRRRRRRGLWWGGAALFWVVVIAYLLVIRLPSVDANSLLRLPHLDKFLHAALFGTLCFLLIRYFTTRTSMRQPVLTAAAITVAYGGLTELVQALFIPYRSGDWLDLLADTTGVLLAVVAWRLLFAPRLT